MPFDGGSSNIPSDGYSPESDRKKIDSFSHSHSETTINTHDHAGNMDTKPSLSIGSAVPPRLHDSQTGFMSVFSVRQRKSTAHPHFQLGSVKNSRLKLVSKINGNIQSISDLIDFLNRAVKAENKMSNALWHTVQYSKSREFEENNTTSAQYTCTLDPTNSTNLNSGTIASSSGDNSVVDSSISEMATETSPSIRTNGLQGSSASQAKQFLQCLVDANESRAEVAACRSSFHKKITISQLQMVLDCLCRLRSKYLELDTKLETYSSQLEADVRECRKKYAKYADSATRQRSRVSLLLEKSGANKQKAIDSTTHDLDGITVKLYMAHNTYTLSLITARRYQQWLVTQLQPCLCRNISRCLELVDYAVSYLLRLARVDQAPKEIFDSITPPNLKPLGDFNLDVGFIEATETVTEDTFRRAFPFDSHLLIRAGDEALQPEKIVINQMTSYPLQKLLQTHLQEVANQGDITRIFEKDYYELASSLSTWISVLSSAGPLIRDLPTDLKTDEAMTRLLEELAVINPLETPSKSDAEKVFLGAATKPATLCSLAIQLGTCEFFYYQSMCFADSHAQIVKVLQRSELTTPVTRLQVNTSSLLSVTSRTPAITSAFAADDTRNGLSAVGSTSLDILEPRFHCLRVHIDNQDGSITVGGRSSPGESHLENDIDVEAQNEVVAPSLAPSATDVSTSISFRNTIKPGKEGFSSLTTFLPMSKLPLTDTRSPNRHLALVNKKEPHKFQKNRFVKKNGCSSQTPSVSLVSQDRVSGGSSNISIEPICAVNGAVDNDGLRQMDQDDVDINKEPWFHGVLPRSEVTRLLKNQGDFLVRETSKTAANSYLERHTRGHYRRRGGGTSSITDLWSSTSFSATMSASSSSSTMTFLGAQSTEDLHCNTGNGGGGGEVVIKRMVLSVYWDGYKHFIIQGGNEAAEGSADLGNRRGGWSFEEYEFSTLSNLALGYYQYFVLSLLPFLALLGIYYINIRDLIEYHIRTGKPITQSSGAILLNPISRPDWQLDNKDVILLEKIGQGNFGEVHRGIYNGRYVAVKTCRASPAEVEIRRKFLQGETTALNFFHPNVVRLLGIAVRSHPIMIVMEYVAGGSLLSFLRKSGQNADICLLLRMCVDAANGMAYLESKNCIHRDLAARNCLLTKENVLKIADFGMAREEHVYEPGQSGEERERLRRKKSKKLSDRNGPIPIKWTAPEALYSNRYTSKCDVWSFGILLWEIFSAGDPPYHGLSNSETRDLVEHGYRLTIPDRMPRQLGKYMQSCWHHNPNRRPTFSNLVISLSQLKREFRETEGVSPPSSESDDSTITGVTVANSATTNIVPSKQHQQLTNVLATEIEHSHSQSSLTHSTESQVQPPSSNSVSVSTTTSRLPRTMPVTASSEASVDAEDIEDCPTPVGFNSEGERL